MDSSNGRRPEQGQRGRRLGADRRPGAAGEEPPGGAQCRLHLGRPLASAALEGTLDLLHDRRGGHDQDRELGRVGHGAVRGLRRRRRQPRRFPQPGHEALAPRDTRRRDAGLGPRRLEQQPEVGAVRAARARGRRRPAEHERTLADDRRQTHHRARGAWGLERGRDRGRREEKARGGDGQGRGGGPRRGGAPRQGARGGAGADDGRRSAGGRAGGGRARASGGRVGRIRSHRLRLAARRAGRRVGALSPDRRPLPRAAEPRACGTAEQDI
mmetsp:Transcript_5537/g.13978  ORF Transcript_5537/g.13978 Transcript_5537/m.13978 type:complete len:270 (+) Transcript_5537:1019-1828(+)